MTKTSSILMMKVAVMTVMVKVKIVMTRVMIPTKSDCCIICNYAIQLPQINFNCNKNVDCKIRQIAPAISSQYSYHPFFNILTGNDCNFLVWRCTEKEKGVRFGGGGDWP